MSDRLWIGTRKGLFRLDRSDRGRWRIAETAFLGVPVPIVLPDARDASLYAALDHGHFGCKIHRSIDAGASFEEIGVPTYPPAPPESDDVLALQRTPLDWSLKGIWSLEAGGDDEQGTLWCGTLPGGLFVSSDHGANWSLVRSLWDDPRRQHWFGGGMDTPGIHSIQVDPRDPSLLRIGISCGGIWQTNDHGETWQLVGDGMRAAYLPPDRGHDPNTQDPHRLVQCRSHPERFWVQHHNGIFRSDDGCRTFTEIDDARPSSFGFATAVHPDDPDTAWFVPAVEDACRIPVDAHLVVTRTRDGGRTFDVLDTGLPDGPAYDVVYRHALDVDATGDRLAFGSTTGALWTSDDQGDSWQNVSTHLPPIYCVRFG